MHQLAKQLKNEDRVEIPVEEQVWHSIKDASGDPALVCTGEFIDEGCGDGEYILKVVKRGGITCKECMSTIKHFKAIKL